MPLSQYNGFSNQGNCRPRHNLVKKRSQHEFRNQFFSSRVIEGWNSLPNSLKEASTVIVSVFKRRYRRHLETTVALATEG